MQNLSTLLLYTIPLLIFFGVYFRRRARSQAQHVGQLHEAVEAGLTEPVSLHPVVDPNRCIGSSGCVKACPEGAIGVIDGKAQLVNPSVCIGHGACAASCPFEAIKLVFGSGAPRRRYSVCQAELRDQRARHIHRRRARRHGPHPQSGGAGATGDHDDQGCCGRRRRARRGHRRRRPGGHRCRTGRNSAQAQVPPDRAGGISGWDGVPLSPEQDRDDRSGPVAARRQDEVQRGREGSAARLLAGGRAEDRTQGPVQRAHGSDRAVRTAASW